jgi:hypothetical protein
VLGKDPVPPLHQILELFRELRISPKGLNVSRDFDVFAWRRANRVQRRHGCNVCKSKASINGAGVIGSIDVAAMQQNNLGEETPSGA